jgi:Protein of unknown function (DUF2510)/Restriction endonuclease
MGVAPAGWYADPTDSEPVRYWDGNHWIENAAPDVISGDRLPAPVSAPADLGRPAPRRIRSPAQAAAAVAEWLRWMGFADAVVTGAGADGGVAVRAGPLIGQVKSHIVPIGCPDVQRLHGVAQSEQKIGVFFSLMAFTAPAVAWAKEVGMPLFRFDNAGEVEPVNELARNMMERPGRDGAAGAGAAASGRELIWAFTPACDDATAVALLAPKRIGVRTKERLAWVREGWLPFVGLRIDYTFLQGKGRKARELPAHTTRTFEMMTGKPLRLPKASLPLRQMPVSALTIRHRHSAEELVEDIAYEWNHFLELRQTAAMQRAQAILTYYGVPPQALSISATVTHRLLLPFYVGLVEGAGGSRLGAVEGAGGTLHQPLEDIFTRLAPELLPELLSGRPVFG